MGPHSRGSASPRRTSLNLHLNPNYAGAGVPQGVKEAFETYQGRVVVVGLNLENTKEQPGNSMKLAKNPWQILTRMEKLLGLRMVIVPSNRIEPYQGLDPREHDLT